jgi:hypothetical protein
MSVNTAQGGWLVSKKCQYQEEAVYGIAPSGSYNQIGYDSQVLLSAPTNLTPLLTPGNEHPIVLQEIRIDQYNLDIQYRPFDTVFAKYGFNAQGGGSGTIDKSLTLAMSILLGGSTETFIQALGCRIDRISIGGRAGGPISVKARIASQNIPVFTSSLLGTFAQNPSSIPLQFKDGGAQPVNIGGTQYNTNSIMVNADRFLDRIPQPGSDIAQLIIPTTRKITGTIGLVFNTTDNYTRLRNDTSYTLTWTLKTGGSTLTLTGCRFKMLESLNLSPQSTIYESYNLECTSAVLT